MIEILQNTHPIKIKKLSVQTTESGKGMCDVWLQQLVLSCEHLVLRETKKGFRPRVKQRYYLVNKHEVYFM